MGSIERPTISAVRKRRQRVRLSDLPSKSPIRWVTARKEELVLDVQSDALSIKDACKKYDLSLDELISWVTVFKRSGRAGLRATRVQQYRPRIEQISSLTRDIRNLNMRKSLETQDDESIDIRLDVMRWDRAEILFLKSKII